MMWKIYPKLGEICTELKAKKAAGEITHLMGFNEPDHPGQSNLKVDECLKNWPLLMETGLPLISPGAAWMWGNWMRDFMAGVKERNYRVDAISVHWYGNPDPKDFLSRIRSAYELYKRPLWITEFTVHDKGASATKPNRHSPGDVAKFMRTVLAELEKFDFVERYAWFGRPGAGHHLTSSTIYGDGGKLTDLGKVYASF